MILKDVSTELGQLVPDMDQYGTLGVHADTEKCCFVSKQASKL